MKIKNEHLDTEIWVPYTNSNQVCRFIDVRLYDKLSKLYPNIFEVEQPKVEIKKEKTTNDLHKSDTISPNLYDSKTKPN